MAERRVRDTVGVAVLVRVDVCENDDESDAVRVLDRVRVTDRAALDDKVPVRDDVRERVAECVPLDDATLERDDVHERVAERELLDDAVSVLDDVGETAVALDVCVTGLAFGFGDELGLDPTECTETPIISVRYTISCPTRMPRQSHAQETPRR